MYNLKKGTLLLKFLPLSEMPQNLAEFLEETFEVIAIDYTADGKEQYVCYADKNFDLNAFIKQATALTPPLPPFTTEELKEKNWLKENVIKFAPYETGAFMVYGIHESTCPKTDKIPVQVYAATAFGSEHQTTKMCLNLLSLLPKNSFSPKKILDMGTGSGILAIAAAKLWHLTPQIIAADIDEESVAVTENNAITNNVEKNISVYLSSGYTNPAINNNAPYDLITANILANPLTEMAADAYNALAPEGYYIISGFIESQLNDIISVHTAAGLAHIKTLSLDNWRAVLLKKSKGNKQ